MGERYLSLFSGIGGFDLAVESLGFECAGQVEWDEHCTRVLEQWWPTVPRWGDVREFTAAAYADSRRLERPSQASATSINPYALPVLQQPDLICGGFPCQSVSNAGKRRAQDDERWLWPEYARVIDELRPRLVLVENSSGLRTAGRQVGEGPDDAVWDGALFEILGDLADMGFDARWCSVRASDVGACHPRERIFLFAHTTGEPRVEFDGEPERPPTDATPRGFRRGQHLGQSDSLNQTVRLLPTPTMRDHKGRNQRDDDSYLTGALLPTPGTSDANGAGNHGDGGPDLRTALRGDLTNPPSDAGSEP